MTDDIWIEANLALGRAAELFGNTKAGREELTERLRLGLLRTKADRLVETSDSGNFAWKAPPVKKVSTRNGQTFIMSGPQKELRNVEIATAVWSTSIEPANDQRRWQWKPGNFVITLRHPERSGLWLRTQAFGLKFLLAEIDELCGVTKAQPAPPVLQTQPDERERIPTWDWEGALIAMMMFADHDGLEQSFGDIGVRGATAKMVGFFTAYFRKSVGKEPSPSAMNRRAASVISALARAKRLGLDPDLLNLLKKK